MKAKMFEELLESVREAGAILRGQRKTARRFELKSPGYERFANEPLAVGVRTPDGCQREDASKLGAGPAPSNRTSRSAIEDHRVRATAGGDGNTPSKRDL